jgi:predicted XRE-type DNA-binding protein
MTEEYGHIPDAFHLSQSEIEDLRNAKKELTTYGKDKMREYMKRKEMEKLKEKQERK